MDKKNEHINHLTPEIIQAYHSGKLTSKQMHQVEILMLENPLYAEGMEGIESLFPEELSLDLDSLTANIDGVTTKHKTPFWTFWKRTAAAILILITAAGLMIINRPDKIQTKELSEVKTPFKNPPTDSTSRNDLPNDDTPIIKETESLALKKVAPKSSDSQSNEDKKQASTLISTGQIETIDIDRALAGNLLENKVSGLRIERPLEQSTRAPRFGEKPILDSSFSLSEKVISKLINSELSKLELPLEDLKSNYAKENPVTAPKDNAGNAVRGKVAGVRVGTPIESKNKVFELAIPIDGNSKFKRYLRNNIRYPETAKTQKVRGRVTLEFDVSATGELSNFKIVKGLGYGCDEEAIRLVKEGPQWNPKTEGVNKTPVKSTVKIRVRFRP